MRTRALEGLGVYGVKLFDFSRPRGQHEVPEWDAGIDADLPAPPHPYHHSNQTVAVFVLDVRTNKSPWKKGSGKYLPDFEGDFLGEQQWQWFEQSIRRSRASVNIVVNGLQVHAQRFLDGNVAESWAQYPRSQQRLFDAVLNNSVEAPILVSGDVHMAQLMRKDCATKGEYSVSRSLLEFTTRYVAPALRSHSIYFLIMFLCDLLYQRYDTFLGHAFDTSFRPKLQSIMGRRLPAVCIKEFDPHSALFLPLDGRHGRYQILRRPL